MKKTPVTYYLLDLSPKTLPNDFTNRETTKQAEVLSLFVSPPTEEMINHLNRIGREYPFCVYYKQKMNDPL
jgi:hypothetical protein